MADEMRITVLENGTIKIDTDRISGPNHMGAEGFIREIFRLAGGQSRRTLKTNHSLHAALHAHCHDGHTHQH